MKRKTFETDMEKRFEQARKKLKELEEIADDPKTREGIKNEIRRLRKKQQEFQSEFKHHEKEVGNIWQMMNDLMAGALEEFMDSVENLAERVRESQK
ncbi:MAG: hypothetical protein JXL67_13865 [Calditrichaeota bacterium]|nr:hypothetical protein [Calditrichota bacterium]